MSAGAPAKVNAMTRSSRRPGTAIDFLLSPALLMATDRRQR